MLTTTPANLLIVDDDDVDRELIRRGLRRAGVPNPVTMAANGQDALDLLRGTADTEPLPEPFIVILDWKMPRMNGPEFLTALRADGDLRTSVVFVVTTSRDERDQRVAFEHLVAGYIVKENAGENFVALIDLIRSYGRVVELPVRRPSGDPRPPAAEPGRARPAAGGEGWPPRPS